MSSLGKKITIQANKLGSVTQTHKKRQCIEMIFERAELDLAHDSKHAYPWMLPADPSSTLN